MSFGFLGDGCFVSVELLPLAPPPPLALALFLVVLDERAGARGVRRICARAARGSRGGFCVAALSITQANRPAPRHAPRRAAAAPAGTSSAAAACGDRAREEGRRLGVRLQRAYEHKRVQDKMAS